MRVQLPPGAAQDTFEAICAVRLESVPHCPRADQHTFGRDSAAPKMRLGSSSYSRVARPASSREIAEASPFGPRFFNVREPPNSLRIRRTKAALAELVLDLVDRYTGMLCDQRCGEPSIA